MSTTVRSTKVFQVWPEQLVERKGNNRFDYGDLNGLSQSILNNGIKMPLTVRKTKLKTDDGYPVFEIIDGVRRSRAANKIAAKMEVGDFVPVQIVGDDFTDADVLLTALITGEHGKPRNMLEAARDINALLALGKKQKDIATAIGKSAMYVSDCLMLVDKATPALTKQIESGQVTAYTVLEMLKATPAGAVEEAVTKAAAKKGAKEESIAPEKRKPLKATQIEEEHGAPMTAKGKKASYAKERTEDVAGAKPKDDATMLKLLALRDTMKANDGSQKKITFGVLSGLINYCKGKVTAMELLPLFFWEVDEEADTNFTEASTQPVVEAPAKGKQKAAVQEPEPEPVPAKGKKKVVEPEPAKKPAKAATKPAGKKKVADEDELDEDINTDLPDIEEEDEDWKE